MIIVKYRLGLDLGTNSIGGTILPLDSKGRPKAPIWMFSHIFSDGRDPKSKSSLAENRTDKRGARKNRDRYLDRRRKLMNKLVSLRLMPEDKEERKALENKINPYQVRAEALDRPLKPFELGRALFHLNQRRGFQSNRKTDGKQKQQAKAEKRDVKQEMEELEKAIKESKSRTLGEFLWKRLQQKLPVRATPDEGRLPKRNQYKEEFDIIREKQAKHHSHVKAKDWNELRNKIIFYQRELKPQERGRCLFLETETRAPRALPSFWKFSIAQDVSNLKIIHPDRTKHPLTTEQKDKLFDSLSKIQKKNWKSIRNLLELGDEFQFNLEMDTRKELKGNATASRLSGKKYFNKAWYEFDDAMQDEIVETLLDMNTEEALAKKAVNEWGLDEEHARNLAKLTPDDFPKGYARFCKEILQKLTPLMRDDHLPYSDAVLALGHKHSEDHPENISPKLEYYGKLLPTAVMGANPDTIEKSGKKIDESKRYGKIGNPTVHIGLNQLRHVINALIETYGPPEEIAIELVRELKMNGEEKKRLAKEQFDNKKTNDRIKTELAELINKGVSPDNRNDVIKYKLWEELNPKDINGRLCPYSGKRISLSKLFSSEVEVEHILPEGATLDKSIGNRTVSYAAANRKKGKRSPYEAFANESGPYQHNKILDRVKNLPGRKKWRFESDAMERFEDENEFLKRQLTDTAYYSRIAKKYLSHICPHNKIWVVPGRLTAMLRHQLGLDAILGKQGVKNRDDHRHHAIDALIVGLTDRKLLQGIRSYSQGNGRGLRVKEPWKNFYETVKEKVDRIVVSHRPDHSIQGPLHEETSYGIIKHPSEWEKEHKYNVGRKKILKDLKSTEIDKIRDVRLRKQLLIRIHGLTDKEYQKALIDFGAEKGIQKIKLLKKRKPHYPHTPSPQKPSVRQIRGSRRGASYRVLENA